MSNDMDAADAPASMLDLLKAALAKGELVAQATLVAGIERPGAKMLVYGDERVVGSLGSELLDREVQKAAREAMVSLRGKLAWTESYGATQEARVFIELFPPPPHLVIFGGVHIALPLITYARTLGFRVTLADPRSTFANAERFPEADAIITEWPREAVEQLEIGPTTYCVILTHDPKIDQPALLAVLGKQAAYIGAIGSRATHAERFERMKSEGVPPEALAEVYAPIGLDLNAETPEEIALAIMAEIVAVRRGGSGGFMKQGPPASRPA